jgi:hypothetical protein
VPVTGRRGKERIEGIVKYVIQVGCPKVPGERKSRKKGKEEAETRSAPLRVSEQPYGRGSYEKEMVVGSGLDPDERLLDIGQAGLVVLRLEGFYQERREGGCQLEKRSRVDKVWV